MDKNRYKLEVNKKRETIYGTSFDEIQSLGLLGTFSLVSANLLRYLDRKSDEHYKIIQGIQFNRSLANMDQLYPHMLQELKVIDTTDVFKSKSDKGHIFVTFHTGSYRLFIQHLNRSGLPFCLVTEGKYIEEQGKLTQALFKKVNSEGKGLEILEAENPRLLFELMRKINSGISVVFYIDGNTGVSEKKLSENKNLLKIDFLKSEMYARQGIAMLAYLSKSQVIMALPKRNKDLSNTIRIKKIETKKYEKYSRNDFVNCLTKKLFSELGDFLRKYPEQWEGWFYIQKFFEQETIEKSTESKEKYSGEKEIKLEVDQQIQLLKYNEDNVFVIQKKDYQIMKITPLLYSVLNHFKTPKNIITNTDTTINNQTIEWEFLEELIEMKFLSA